MVSIVLIGLAAGLAAALLFASVASGSLLAVSLFYLAPLPVMIAALGWSHLAGLIAALVAAASLAAIFGNVFFIAFLVGVGLPAWWLGYLALLARPSATSPEDLDWFPPGRLVIWSAILATLAVTLAIPNFGFDAESFRSGLRHAFEQIFQFEDTTLADAPIQIPGLQIPGLPSSSSMLDIMVIIIPPMAATLATFTNVANLWLAGRIVKVSGRLKRPWPDIAAMRFPKSAPMLLALAITATLTDTFIDKTASASLIGVLGSVLTASLLMAYAILGFSIVHAIARPLRIRGPLLAGTYAIVAIFGWPILLMAVLGLADTAIDIRGRLSINLHPPAAPP